MTSSFITSRPGVLQISTISSFRWLAVGFSIVAIIIVVQILDVSKIDSLRSNKLQEDPSIAAEDLQGINERMKFDIATIRAKRVNVHVEKRTFSANRSEGNRYGLTSLLLHDLKKKKTFNKTSKTDKQEYERTYIMLHICNDVASNFKME